MPHFTRLALEQRGLIEKHRSRPPYQRNDYIGWIMRAKLATTRQKRLKQMLAELEQGGVYVKMSWNGGYSAAPH